ncbi:MAG: AlkA N-terminal domain-containing protein [Sciscionella sp.]
MQTETTSRTTKIWTDPERAYRAVETRDPRFDGRFITAVRTTGIYCRPSCPAMTPKRRNTEFFATAAAAQAAGYRACRRCLPDAVPGSPEWNLRSDLAGRAMRLIADGIIERDGVTGLAQRLGYSQRQVTRVLTTELGAGPLALARAHRAQAARVLIETTRLPFTDIAFAAGFASVRQFNETIHAVFACAPSQLRDNGHVPVAGAGTISLRLAFRSPMDAAGLFGFLATRAVSGVESVTSGGYARTLRLPHGPAIVHLAPAHGYIDTSLRLTDLRDLGTAVARLRRLLDLDADPTGVDEVLSADPVLAGRVAAVPGIRLPGSVDGAEIVLRAMLGQQISVAAARTALGRLTAALGEPLPHPEGELTRLFPEPAAIAEQGTEVLRGPARRVASVLAVCAALADGTVDVHVGRDAEQLRADLEALPGVGPWTAGYVLMRVLGSSDELLTSDLVLRRGAAALGLPSESPALLAYSRRWQPWRAYAGMHLWRAAPSHRPISHNTARRSA